MEDYDFNLLYHLGMANVVIDTLSRKSQEMMASLELEDWTRCITIRDFD